MILEYQETLNAWIVTTINKARKFIMKIALGFIFSISQCPKERTGGMDGDGDKTSGTRACFK